MHLAAGEKSLSSVMRHKTSFKFAIGVLLAIALLWFLFRNTSWPEVFEAIQGVNLIWATLAVGATLVGQVLRVQRWGYMVRATHPASFRSMFSATQIGFLVNIAVPARIGELIRAYALSRLEKISLSKSTALVALDRLYDVLVLIVLFLITLFSFPLGRDVEFSAETFNTAEPVVISSAYIRPVAIGLIVFFLGAAATLVFLFVKQDLVVKVSSATVGRVSEKLATRLNRLFFEFAEGMHIFRSAADLAKCFLFSLLTWTAPLLALAFTLFAFGIEFPWFTPFFVLCMSAAFIVIPLTPGMVGQYHLAVVVSLIMAVPEVPVPEAKAFALILHLVGFAPIVLLGIYCLLREGFTIADMSKQLARQETKPR